MKPLAPSAPPIFEAPNIIPNPITQKAIELTAKTMKFLARMWTAFFRRHRPASRVAKPAFIQNTSMPQMSVQTVLAMTEPSAIFVIASSTVGGGVGAGVGAASCPNARAGRTTAAAIATAGNVRLSHREVREDPNIATASVDGD